jgi:hypothetical protein
MSLRAWIPLLAVAATPPAASADEDPAVAAREREKLVRTARFEVHVREVNAKGSISRQVNPPAPEPLPTEEVDFDFDNVLVLDGNKVRVEMTYPEWSGRRLLFRRLPLVSVWDGERGLTFHPNGFGPAGGPTGIVTRKADDWVKSAYWSPLTLTVRGLNPNLVQYPIPQLTATDRTEAIDGHMCREYTAGPDPDRLVRFWLDPQAGHVVRRVVLPQGPFRTTDQLDVRFRPDETTGWLPSGWTLTEADADGNAVRTITATVTAARLNEPVPEHRFELTFPPPTIIHDQFTGTSYRIGPDGSRREVGPGGAELVVDPANEPVDEPPLRPGSPRERGLIAGGVVAVGLAVLLAVWLRLRRSPRPRAG